MVAVTAAGSDHGAAEIRPARSSDQISPLRSSFAERRTTSEMRTSCFVSGLVFRQIMPIVRDGLGFPNRASETAAERVSTATAISGISVTPIPAPTI